MKKIMRKNLMRMAIRAMGAMVMISAGMMTAFADSSSEAENNPTVPLIKVSTPIKGLIDQVLLVLLPLVGAVGAIFCISLGVKYSKAEEPQEREKAKHHLKSAIIGFSLVFILVVALKIAEPLLTDWMKKAGNVH